MSKTETRAGLTLNSLERVWFGAEVLGLVPWKCPILSAMRSGICIASGTSCFFYRWPDFFWSAPNCILLLPSSEKTSMVPVRSMALADGPRRRALDRLGAGGSVRGEGLRFLLFFILANLSMAG